MSILIYPILISILAGLLVLVFPRRLRKIIENFSLFIAIYLFISSINIFCKSPVHGKWLYVDGLSRFIVLGIGFFGVLVTFYSLRFMAGIRDFRTYYGNIIWTIGVSILAVVSNNILLLLVAWGFLGFTLYMLINIGGGKAASTAKKTFIIVGGSDSLMIMGFAIVWFITNEFSLSNIKITIDNASSFWAFLLIAIGAFAKAGTMPFHTWVPDTAEDAPIPVTALLPASLDKLLGIYLLARLILDVFILNNFTCALLMVAGAVTIVAAVMMALIQHDFKKLLGYHAVSQVGYMVLGLGTGNIIGIAGGLFHMLNNAFYKCCLFLTGGNVQYKTNTSRLDFLGGLSRSLPITFYSGLIAALAISGVPPLNGFFSKWMIYQALVEKGKAGGALWIFCVVAAIFGSALTLASFIKLIHSIFLGKAKDNSSIQSHRGLDKDIPFSMWLAPAILAFVCIIFGIFAYVIPLGHIIVPALPGSLKFIGVWPTLKATLFLFIGLIVGGIIYLTGNVRVIRETEPYIGGEKMKKEMGFSGEEFYGTVKELPVVRVIYMWAERKAFDIYEVFKKILFVFIRVFQYLHNGVLPTYLVWCLIGMIVFLFTLVR